MVTRSILKKDLFGLQFYGIWSIWKQKAQWQEHEEADHTALVVWKRGVMTVASQLPFSFLFQTRRRLYSQEE